MKTVLLFGCILLLNSCRPQTETPLPNLPELQGLEVDHEGCRTDTAYNAVSEESRYRNAPDSLISWRDLCNQLNIGKLHADTIGEFQDDTSGTYLFPVEMRHTLSTILGLIEITYSNDKLILRKNGTPIKINTWYGEEISTYNLSPSGPAIHYASGINHYIVFETGFTLCNGTGCGIVYHFIINLNENTAFVIPGRDVGVFPLFACDYNSDSVIDFMFPHYVQHYWCPFIVTDSTEFVHFIPLNETSAGIMKPMLNPSGDTVFFRSFIHFEYGTEQSRIWSTAKEGRGIAFLKSPLIE